MRIALDAMGGDRAPAEIVRGAVDAARLPGVEVVLVGEPALLEAELRRLSQRPAGVSLQPASEAIGMDEHPLAAIRGKRAKEVLARKCASVRGEDGAFLAISGGPEYVRAACAAALRRLGVHPVAVDYHRGADPAYG